jgi:SAM-dependent MidA family methyltransferase
MKQPFDVFMADALYGPNGFYATGRGAGRHRDFITSPELGPLFGAVFARALREFGAHRVIEAGSGTGSLRDAILAEGDFDYVSVEFADAWPDHSADVVIANELVDNLPFKIAERVDGGWVEVMVDGRQFALGEPIALELEAPEGTRVPIHTEAQKWLARARQTAPRVVLVDYGAPTTADLVGRQWLRTYQEHGRGFDPLRDPGSQDITTDVAWDQLQPDLLTTQADWLRAHGIDELVEEARTTWRERAHIGDLAALKARARVNEADALLDPGGPGGFLVAEWLP